MSNGPKILLGRGLTWMILLAATLPVSSSSQSFHESKTYPAYRIEGVSKECQITEIAEIPGGLLIGTYKEGLWRLANGSKRAEPIEGLPENASVLRIAHVNGRTLIGAGINTQESPYDPAGRGLWILKDGDTQVSKVRGIPEGIPDVICQVGPRSFIGVYHRGLWVLSEDGNFAVGVPGPEPVENINEILNWQGTAVLVTNSHGVWSVGPNEKVAKMVGAVSGEDDNEKDGITLAQGLVKLGKGILIGTTFNGLWKLDDLNSKAKKLAGIKKGQGVFGLTANGNEAIFGTATGLFRLKETETSMKEIGNFTGDRSPDSIARMGGQILVATGADGLWLLPSSDEEPIAISGIPKKMAGGNIAASASYAIIWNKGDISSPNLPWVLKKGAKAAFSISGLPEPSHLTTDSAPEPSYITIVSAQTDRAVIGTKNGLWAISL